MRKKADFAITIRVLDIPGSQVDVASKQQIAFDWTYCGKHCSGVELLS
jgi:hypothetical protein